MASSQPDGSVCVIGNLLQDVIVRGVAAMPAWGHETAGSGHSVVSSGQAGYLSLALSALDVPNGVVGVVGADDAGRRIRDELATAGAEVSGVIVTDRAPTAITVAVVRPDGERAFISDFAALAEVDEDFVLRHWEHVERSAVVCLVGLFNLPNLRIDAAANALRRARTEGRLTMLDPGWDPADWPESTVRAVRGVLPVVDVFLPNADEATALTGADDPEEAAARLVRDGAGLVVVKTGSDGCVARRGEQVWREPAVPTAVNDTVGAGDVFNAGLISALRRGDDVRSALVRANATASLYVARKANRFPTAAEVEAVTRAAGQTA